MSFFDFMKKKKEREEAPSIINPLRDPFTSMSGEKIISPPPPAPSSKPLAEESLAKPIDPFDLVPDAPFKPLTGLEKDVDEVEKLLKSIVSDLNSAVDRLMDIKRRLRR